MALLHHGALPISSSYVLYAPFSAVFPGYWGRDTDVSFRAGPSLPAFSVPSAERRGSFYRLSIVLTYRYKHKDVKEVCPHVREAVVGFPSLGLMTSPVTLFFYQA